MLTHLAIFALVAASISGQPLQGRSQKTDLLVAVGILEEQVQDVKQKVIALPNSGEFSVMFEGFTYGIPRRFS